MKAAQQEIRVLKKRRQRRKKKRIINVNDPILFIAFKAFGIAIVGVFVMVSIFPCPDQEKYGSSIYFNNDEVENIFPSPDQAKYGSSNYFNNDEVENIFPHEYLGTGILNISAFNPKGGMRYEEWINGSTPYTVTKNLTHESDLIAYERREHIKNAMKHAWKGYKKYAFGYDEVKPVSGGRYSHWGGIGTTLIDSLDTLWLMDMKDEFWEARDWVRDELNQDKDVYVSVFETTIRSLGGLLSAYTWSKDASFLDKAKDIGAKLFKAFPENLGLPSGQINLKTGNKAQAEWLSWKELLSEVGTLQLEFRDLAHVIEKEEYATKSEQVFRLLKDVEPDDGLFPYFLHYSGNKIHFQTSEVSFGAYADSFFEYELKVWLQGGRKESMYREMYDKSIDGMHKRLLHVSDYGLWFISSSAKPTEFEHLTCFMGGLLALGAYTDPNGLDSNRAQRDLKTSKQLAYTCYQMYAQMPTGLAPDVIEFSRGLRGGKKIISTKHDYGLRPETVETLFILYTLTGDPIYRTWGWEIFQSIEKYCKTSIAYGSYPYVGSTDQSPEDKMESFFLAETLKYLYLLNDPDTEIDILNKHVFNTEAHPFTIF